VCRDRDEPFLLNYRLLKGNPIARSGRVRGVYDGEDGKRVPKRNAKKTNPIRRGSNDANGFQSDEDVLMSGDRGTTGYGHMRTTGRGRSKLLLF